MVRNSQAAEAEGVALATTRKPFMLRPERVGQKPWKDVLRELGVSRGNPGWVESFVGPFSKVLPFPPVWGAGDDCPLAPVRCRR